MEDALTPYYGGDHKAHARRILATHLAGGLDDLGHFSFEQRMFILTVNKQPAGMIHLVGKRQFTYKISPIIVAPGFRIKRRLGTRLLQFAERYARQRGARQLYCTVAQENTAVLQFFLRHGFTIAGASASHYKPGITEAMLYKQFYSSGDYEAFDRANISVVPYDESLEPQVRPLLLNALPRSFSGISSVWVDSLFDGYKRRESKDVNLKYKLIFVAVDRRRRVLGVAGATPKKGYPIKIMPFIAKTLPAFVALLSDVPYELRSHGRKLYIHLMPSAWETMALQQRGWHLDAALPSAYRPNRVTQQWSLDLDGENVMRMMRVKKRFLDLIRSGEKTLEVRVAYPNLQTLEKNEKIRLISRDESEIVVLKDIRRYPSFASMAESEDISKVVPDVRPTEILPLLRRIYPRERESLGVLVLEIGLVRAQLT